MLRDLDSELKRWSEEVTPWARKLAISLGADDVEVSLTYLWIKWYGEYNSDYGYLPQIGLRFRIASRNGSVSLSEIRFRLDFSSYDITFLLPLAFGVDAPPTFASFLEKTKPATPGSGVDPIKTAESLPTYPVISKLYRDILTRWYDKPPEIEDMHVMRGYDEAIIEAGDKAIRKELWKGEFLELLKGIRGEPGWREHVNTPAPGTTNVSWYPPDHTNYYMYFRIDRDAPPRLIVFVDPSLRGSTSGWRAEREFKNYKQVLGLPKSLQAWVLSDIEKMGGQTNSFHYDQMKRVAATGVPHDFERAYQKLRQVLIPAVEPEEMHTLRGYDEAKEKRK
jgi:hypothetical protein